MASKLRALQEAHPAFTRGNRYTRKSIQCIARSMMPTCVRRYEARVGSCQLALPRSSGARLAAAAEQRQPGRAALACLMRAIMSVS